MAPLGVLGRLLGTILVPLVVLAIVLGNVTVSRHHRAELADSVTARVDVLNQLVALRSSLFAERLRAEVLTPGREISTELLATTTFGADLVQNPGRLAERTDAALAALGPEDRPFSAADLSRARIDAASTSNGGAASRVELDELDWRLTAESDANLAAVRGAAIQLGDEEVMRAETTFRRSVQLPAEAGALVAALADLWSAPADERLPLQSEVAVRASEYGRDVSATERALTEQFGRIPALWSEGSELPPALRDSVDAASAGDLSAPDRSAGEPVAVGLSLLEGVDWLVSVDRLPPAAAAAFSSQVRRIADEVRAGSRNGILFAALAFGASVAAAFYFGRSIVRPVRRLTGQARRVGEGQLDVGHLPLDGPPEIASASQALNDMVDTLVLLDRKSQALADCDFDDPAMAQPLPGLLGASLQRSVEVLSDSMQQSERLQSRLAHQATHDSLTGLGNRTALIEKLHQLVEPEPSDRLAAVVFIDLNGFKRINDRHGHAVGDALLQVVGRRLSNLAPGGGLVARLGGDEFVLAMPVVHDEAEPVEVARRLVQGVEEPVTIDGIALHVGASAGVAVVGRSAGEYVNDPLELLRKADLAVYSVKQGLSGSVALYDDELDQRLAAQADVEASLNAALQPGADELRLVFQPIIETSTGALHGLEALVRWDRPGHGPIAPADFVPVAERSALIVDLDRWVMDRVLAQMCEWDMVESTRGQSVSVNVSGRSLLESTFVSQLTEALRAWAVEPSRLSIEVTETALVTDLDLAAVQLAAVRRLGLRVVIDDFGTGYTSVAHLRALPIDELKIDSSFVQQLPDSDNRVLIEMINQLAHHLHIPTVAEGVESIDQVDQLREIGCDCLQGYLFSRPFGPAELSGWLQGRSAQITLLAGRGSVEVVRGLSRR